MTHSRHFNSSRSRRLTVALAFAVLPSFLFAVSPIPVAVAIAAEPANAPAPKPIDLPVTRAVLFASGVGYFEHTGTVSNDAQIRLLFKTEQINDVLKSMVVMDEGGGTIASVTYPSNDPIDRSLRSFGVNLSGNPSLASLLSQLRGAEITVQTPDMLRGKILHVESRTRVTGQPPATVQESWLTLVTDTGIRSLPMDTIQSMELADPKLREELNKALGALVTSRDVDRKPVELRFTGKGERRVRIGYLVETPVWKSSYRLDLGGDKPFLQGWSIVENTSEADWQNVRLSLVSGRPISFTMDLYTPLYAPRPLVVPEVYASLRPRIYDESAFTMDKDNAGAGPGQPMGSRREVAKSMMLREQMSTQNATGRDMRSQLSAPAAAAPMAAAEGAAGNVNVGFSLGQSGVQAMASGGNMGELFSFTIASPVELQRRRSAMLPIINQAITAEKVSIYNISVLRNNPLNGVLLTNDTKLKMVAGPVTVFDGGAYAGDAQVDNLSPGDKRLLSYAVDLSVAADASESATSTITAARIWRGVLHLTRKQVFTQNYNFRNKGDAARTLIIEHPFRAERKLVEPAKPEEKTPTVYRFRLPLEASKTATLAVKEEQSITESIAILPQGPESLVWYTQTQQISPAVREALSRAIVMKQEIGRLENELNALRQERQQIGADQDRLRQNLNSVGRDSTLGKRYLTKFSEQETRLEELDKQIEQTQKNLDAKRNELADYIGKLELN